MLGIRQLLRVYTQKCTRSLSEKVAPQSLVKVPRKVFPLPQKHIFEQKLNIHTSHNTCSTENQFLKEKQVLGKIDGKLRLTFTCKRCNTRSTKIITKVGYERGVVIIRCDGCKNNHLIADNLGWFADISGRRNIEGILAAKGERVRKLHDYTDGSLQIVDSQEFPRTIENNSPKDESTTLEKVVDVESHKINR